MTANKQIDSNKCKELLVESAEKVFSTMISMQVEPVNTSEFNLQPEELHFSAVIGFSGGWNGCVSFQCGEILAKKITSVMLMINGDELEDADIRDAMGEIVNMISGNFKSGFSGTFNDGTEAFKMSIPSVTVGKNYTIFAAGSHSQIMVVLGNEEYNFYLDLALRKSNEG